MAEYRYLFYDLLTNQPITEFPLNGVSFTQQLNSAGTLSGTMLLTDATTDTLDIIAGTIPAKTALYVERSDLANNVGRSLVWGGIIWGREYNSDTQTININAREFESYFEKGIILPWELAGLYSGSNTAYAFPNIDQFLMVRAIVQARQSDPLYTNIGVAVNATTSGVLVSPTYAQSDLKNHYQAILDLSQANNGFDFNIDVYYDGEGVPQKVMNLGYPQIGYRWSASDPNAPTLQLPGNIQSYSYLEDGSIVANHVYVTGANELVAVADNPTAVDPDGYPFYDGAFNYGDITSQTALQGIADGRAFSLGYPPTTLKVVQVANQEPTVGRVAPGDDVRVIINDARFPAGLNAIYRVTAITFTPNEGGGSEQITYSLTEPNDVYN